MKAKPKKKAVKRTKTPTAEEIMLTPIVVARDLGAAAGPTDEEIAAIGAALFDATRSRSAVPGAWVLAGRLEALRTGLK